MKNPIIKSRLGRLLIGPAMVGALVGGIGVATAQTGDDTAPSTTIAEQAPPAQDSTAAAQEDTTTAPSNAAPATPGEAGTGAGADEAARPGPGRRGQELTGETAEKVKAAALAAVPGAAVNRVVEGCGDSAYAAFLTKADGTRVVAEVNEAFEVTEVKNDLGPRRGPGRGPGGGGTPLTGETADKATAAAQQAVPGGTVDRVGEDRDGDGYQAHVVKADDTHVRVEMTEDFKVTSVEEHAGRGPRPAPATQPAA